LRPLEASSSSGSLFRHISTRHCSSTQPCLPILLVPPASPYFCWSATP
jgi:hypothetical protein